MFEFQMELKDSESCNEDAVEEFKICKVDDRRLMNPKFQVKDFTPKDMDEALDFIKKAFFFPPMYVWINGEKLDPTEVENSRIIVTKR